MKARIVSSGLLALLASLMLAPSVYAEVTFAKLHSEVLAPRCIICHAEYETEAGVARDIRPGDPGHSPLYEEVASGAMPTRAPLSAAQILLVREYIEAARPQHPADPVLVLKNVRFKDLSAKILNPRCLLCHSNYRTKAGVLRDIEPGDPDHSILYNYVASGVMPAKGYAYISHPVASADLQPLSRNNIEAIAEFIRELPRKKYPRVAPTWSSLRANLFQRSCVSCHHPGGAAGDNPLETYAQVRALGDEIIERVTNVSRPMPAAHTTMPPSPALVRALKQWIAKGSPR